MLKSLKSEDWVATLMGGVILMLVILVPSVMKNYAYMSVDNSHFGLSGISLYGKQRQWQVSPLLCGSVSAGLAGHIRCRMDTRKNHGAGICFFRRHHRLAYP